MTNEMSTKSTALNCTLSGAARRSVVEAMARRAATWSSVAEQVARSPYGIAWGEVLVAAQRIGVTTRDTNR
jgi:hypothetical protein